MKEIWIKELLSNLDNAVEEKIKQNILIKCGEKCPFTHLSDHKLLELKENSSTESEFLEKLCQQWRLEEKNNKYYVIFDQCYCPLVNQDLKGVSKSLCYCTLGNIKHKFKIGMDRDVDVVMEKTVLSGDNECRFLIVI